MHGRDNVVMCDLLDMTPVDPHLVAGSLLTFNCTLHSDAAITTNSSHMYFRHRKHGQRWQRVAAHYCSSVNSRTLMLRYPNISRSFDAAQFACYIDNDTFVDQMEITVDGTFPRQALFNSVIYVRYDVFCTEKRAGKLSV